MPALLHAAIASIHSGRGGSMIPADRHDDHRENNAKVQHGLAKKYYEPHCSYLADSLGLSSRPVSGLPARRVLSLT